MSTVQIKSYNSDNQAIVNENGQLLVQGEMSVTNPSIGSTGQTAPGMATLVGVVDANNTLRPLLVDPSGKLLVDISGSTTVTGTVAANITGLTAFQTSQYQVATTSVQICANALTNRSNITIRVLTSGSGVVYIGNNSDVTIQTGYPLTTGDIIHLDLTPSTPLYAISNVAGQIVYALEIA